MKLIYKTKQKIFITCILILFSTISCASNRKNLTDNYNISRVWKISDLKQPESVRYDSKRDILYVSNINGAPGEKNGKGFLSKVSNEGKIIDLQWITGLDAPKGLAIKGAKLYVADINHLIEIDIETGIILYKYPAPNAKFLNDVTVDSNGNVYVSDMLDNTIYRLKNGSFKIWIKNQKLEFPNGLYAYKKNLIIASWGNMTNGWQTDTPGHLKKISFKNKSIKSIGSGQPVGNLDGLKPDGRGNYLVTDWMAGKLFIIEPSGKSTSILDLRQGSADLEFILKKNLLIIPMMKDNELLAFKLK